MNIASSCAGAAVMLALCVLGGCGGKSPQEVEAERAKANAEWNTQATGAERVRQAEENRLVQEEIAAHQQREDARQQREMEQRNDSLDAERRRLMQLVAARFPEPSSANFTDARWNAGGTALCGSVNARRADGRSAETLAFVASGFDALLDSADEHERFVDASRVADCPR